MKTRNQDFIRAAGFEPVPCFSGTYNVEAAVQNAMTGKTHFYDAIRRERDDARRKAKRITDFMRSKKRAFAGAKA